MCIGVYHYAPAKTLAVGCPQCGGCGRWRAPGCSLGLCPTCKGVGIVSYQIAEKMLKSAKDHGQRATFGTLIYEE